MARTDVDIARRFVENFDSDHIAETLALSHPNIVLRPAARPARTLYVGYAGVYDFLADVHDAIGYHQAYCDTSVELADGRVEVHGRTVLEDGRSFVFTSVLSVHNGLVIAFETIAAKPGPHATKAPGRQGQPEPSPLG